MTDSQINLPDAALGTTVAVDTKLSGGKHTPQHGIRDGLHETMGAMADAAATTDAGTFSLIALFKRLLGKFPTVIGPTTKAGSLSVTMATDDPQSTLMGPVTETAPATDTASSGLNGRLQRIAQRITSLIALLPAALGAGGGLKVDGSGTALPVSQSGSWADTVTGDIASGSADGASKPVKASARYNSSGVTVTDGQRVDLQADAFGNLGVYLANKNTTFADANSNSQSQVATKNGGIVIQQTFPYILNGTSWDRITKPSLTSRIASAAASVNATSAKGTPGNAHKVFGNNVKASVVYLKLYNKASAPTVGTDTPVLTIPLAASSRYDISINDALGFFFSTGIAYAFTTDATDAGTTALAAGDILDHCMIYA